MTTLVVEVPLNLTLVPDALVAHLAGLKQTQLQGVFPNTLRRLAELGTVGQGLWAERATKVPGPEGRPLRLGTRANDPMVRMSRPEYARSIRVAAGPDHGAPSVVIYSDDRQAPIIEEGGQEIDLHAMLAYAPKARQSARGDKYLRIPFRHATTEAGGPSGHQFQFVSKRWGSNVLPKAVHAAMHTKHPYLVVGHRYERGPNVPGLIKRNVYSKNPGRLTAAELATLVQHPDAPQHRKLIGLMRTGAPRHRQYLTIRTLSKRHPSGWRVAAYEAQHPAGATADDLLKLSVDWFDEALRADVQTWLQGAQA